LRGVKYTLTLEIYQLNLQSKRKRKINLKVKLLSIKYEQIVLQLKTFAIVS